MLAQVGDGGCRANALRLTPDAIAHIGLEAQRPPRPERAGALLSVNLLAVAHEHPWVQKLAVST